MNEGKEEKARERTDAVNVTHRALRKIVVDDEFDPLEVDPASHHIRTNQTPHLALRKPPHDLVSLARAPVRMDRVGVDPIKHELVREFFRALDRLDKDQDGRGELAGGDEGAEGEELVVFAVDEEEALVDRGRRRFSASRTQAFTVRVGGRRKNRRETRGTGCQRLNPRIDCRPLFCGGREEGKAGGTHL